MSSDSGFCSFVVKGDHLDFDFLEETFKMKVFTKHKAGEIVRKEKMESDFIRFNEEPSGKYNPDETLIALAGKLLENKDIVKDLSEKARTWLVCYIQSDYAMMGYTLSAKALSMVAELGIDLGISIFSWGGVRDDRKKKKKKDKKKKKGQKKKTELNKKK